MYLRNKKGLKILTLLTFMYYVLIIYQMTFLYKKKYINFVTV